MNRIANKRLVKLLALSAAITVLGLLFWLWIVLGGSDVLLGLAGAKCTRFSGGCFVKFEEGTRLGWGHVFVLGRIPTKVYLDLTDIAVTDREIVMLTELDRLVWIQMDATRVSSRRVEQLERNRAVMIVSPIQSPGVR